MPGRGLFKGARHFPKEIQFCATCRYLRYERRTEGGPEKARFYCERLRFYTHPKARYRCWTPRPEGQRGILPRET